MEVHSLDKYLSESEEWMLKYVAGEKGLSEVEDPDVFKKCLKEGKTSQGQVSRFLKKDTQKVSTERTWQWLKGLHLKKETEEMICGAQE